MENNSIFVPDETSLHGVLDQINEAVLILDTTAVSGTLLLSLSSTKYVNVTKAHSLLLSASQKTLNMMTSYESFPAFQIDERDENYTSLALNHLIYDTICTVADLYRLLIVSSYLQLFHLLNTDIPRSTIQLNHHTLESNDIDHLLRSIQCCITLLQSLSMIVRQSAFYSSDDFSISATCRGNIRAEGDWHDDYLPKPQYSLLQDCFLRKDRVCLDDGTVFGKDEREISLDVDLYDSSDYLLYRMTNQMQTISSSQSIDKSIGYNLISESQGENVIDEDRIDIFDDVSMNMEQLQHEENILLDVAFPGTARQSTLHHGRHNNRIYSKSNILDSFGDKKSKRKTKVDTNRLAMSYGSIFRLASQYRVSKFIWNQYMYGPVAISERSWLRIHRTTVSPEGQDSTETERVHCLLYATGLLLTFKDELLSEVKCGYEISYLSTCYSFIYKSTLQFKIENVDLHDFSNGKNQIERKINILIDLDEGCENILSEVYLWVTEISRLIKFLSAKKKHNDMIRKLWKS